MTAEEIIAAFGGTKPLAALTGVSRNAVAMWSRDGIPAKYWPLMAREAKAKRLRMTLETMETHTARNRRNGAIANG